MKFKVYSLLLQRRMAQSRLEKIGTIFSRLQGLRKSGAIKSEQVLGAPQVRIRPDVLEDTTHSHNLRQVPIWAEVYEAFPPKYEPRWDATDSEMPVRKILYREDRVRAQYSKVSHKLFCSLVPRISS